MIAMNYSLKDVLERKSNMGFGLIGEKTNGENKKKTYTHTNHSLLTVKL
jgi:hypothetical protein